MGMVFSRLDCRPRWRERLPEIEIPTLVVHGCRDRFFPVGNGEAIAREIPRARLLVLKDADTAIPDMANDEVAEAMLTLGQGPARAAHPPGPACCHVPFITICPFAAGGVAITEGRPRCAPSAISAWSTDR
jgi:hypothetical protein